ncbi:hypothetical protein [Microvirga ossetica]|uniref:hypothetical protein n=1 Tax=Microvirga ossetica TaxID=1882682 RepID=UPI0012FFD8BC|nr:hypothetical protein [Microvirga ossetica]
MSKAPKAETELEALDRELDFKLEGTFPASDPPKITLGMSKVCAQQGRDTSEKHKLG